MGGDALVDAKKRMEELSVAYLHAIASHCGYGADRPSIDHDSVDITIRSSAGRKPCIDLQLKATCSIEIGSAVEFPFPLSIKNYNDLRADTINPRFLIVFCMPKPFEEWIKHTSEELALRKCAFWVSLQGRPETANTDSISIHIPTANILSPDSLHALMQCDS